MVDSRLSEELAKLSDALNRIGVQVKSLLPDVNGNVQINLSRDPKHKPTVNVFLGDMTGSKK